MSRHISTDDLARYVEGDLKPRKAAKVASHLAACADCSDQISELQQVPELLASVQFPPIPEHLSARIEMAIASESAARVASEPASEAGRRDLPVRSKHAARRGWRLPQMSPRLGLQLAAGAAALVVVVGGGYEAVTHLGQSSAPTSNSVSGGRNAALAPSLSPAQLSYGPEVQYHHAGHTDQIQAVQSSTNYQPATFVAEVQNAVRTQTVHNKDQVLGTPSHASSSTTGAVPATTGPANGTAATKFPISDIQRFRGCVDSVAAGRIVLLVEAALFRHSPAAIIVVAQTPTSGAEGYVVRDTCSATNTQVLFSLALPHI